VHPAVAEALLQRRETRSASAGLLSWSSAGYAEAKPRTMRAAGKTFAFTRFVVTGAGRGAIG
jgi:hypothetical protein